LRPGSIGVFDFFVTPKAAVQNSELIMAEAISVVPALASSVIMAVCSLQQIRKPPTGKFSIFPHAKAPLCCAHAIASNFKIGPRSIFEKFRKLDSLVTRHVWSCRYFLRSSWSRASISASVMLSNLMAPPSGPESSTGCFGLPSE
jgi:hypothetical protein